MCHFPHLCASQIKTPEARKEAAGFRAKLVDFLEGHGVRRLDTQCAICMEPMAMKVGVMGRMMGKGCWPSHPSLVFVSLAHHPPFVGSVRACIPAWCNLHLSQSGVDATALRPTGVCLLCLPPTQEPTQSDDGELIMLACMHCLHNKCWDKWLTTNQHEGTATCPTCKQPVPLYSTDM